jgi:spore photoproduct lyase
MIDTIYIEERAIGLPKTDEILSRFPKATLVYCKHYKEIFNPSSQSFRLQKKKPALILAIKTGKFVHPIPESYGVGGKNNFYFSHLLNCLYDCRYCFLQGMYPSAHYVLFVNFDDFKRHIKEKTELSKEPSWFFSGYDCDSLALESVTGFANNFLPFFRELPNAWIELRTKSVAIQSLINNTPLERAVVAFSFTPHEISSQVEHGVPSVKTRIAAMQKIAEQGWKLGLRIDPILDCKDFENRYSNLFIEIFENIPEKAIHSISMGAFRMPKGFYKKIEKQYPEEALLAGGFHTENGYTGYLKETETRLKQKCKNLLTNWTSSQKIYTCQT